MSQCHGRKYGLIRCEIQAGKKWFCHKHKYQPRVAVFGIVTTVVLGIVSGWLIDVIRPPVWPPDDSDGMLTQKKIVDRLNGLPVEKSILVASKEFYGKKLRMQMSGKSSNLHSAFVTHTFSVKGGEITDVVETSETVSHDMVREGGVFISCQFDLEYEERLSQSIFPLFS